MRALATEQKLLSCMLVLGLSSACATAPQEASKATPASLATEAEPKSAPVESYVIEVTTFGQNDAMTREEFAATDREIEATYTSKQPGFLFRLSAVSDDGQWLVVVFWRSAADATASMEKFMTDPSVANYASAIDADSMKMNRYQSRGRFAALPSGAQIVELTTFSLGEKQNPAVFARRDGAVEAAYTSKQPGFGWRESGKSGDGQWLVLVGWAGSEEADKSMARFMADSSVADYATMIDGASMKMARYALR